MARMSRPRTLRTTSARAGFDLHRLRGEPRHADRGARFANVQPAFEAQAKVVWCHAQGEGGFELGVTFLDAEDAFLARMVEQVCHIEEYRAAVRRREGREMTSEEAASEWIGKYAAHFPDPDRLH